MSASRSRLLLVSAVALFVELALIRWLGAEIKIFAYFKNLVLVACFLGFGLGYYRARRDAAVGASLLTVILMVLVVAVTGRLDTLLGPQVASAAFSNYAGVAHMGEEAIGVATHPVYLGAGVFWTLAMVLGSVMAMYGYAQKIGWDIDAFGPGRRIEAYSVNVAGSLLGILAFAAVSRFSLPPPVWFGVAGLATVPLLGGTRERVAGVVGTALVVVALWPAPTTTWSPYQRLDLVGEGVLVNGTGYMEMTSFAEAAPEPYDRWRLPHTLVPDADRVLIVGAGAGNDASAALAAGAAHVTAVEIDPAIYDIGSRLHPDDPYSDPRVTVVVDDARHFAETSDERFDLIVFSHLDSHTALSGFTNMRLDDYVYTVESFRSFSRLLEADGAMYVSFWALRPWIGQRIQANLSLAWGEVPLSLITTLEVRDGKQILLVHYLASADDGVLAGAAAHSDRFEGYEFTEDVVPSTDDWPYLYIKVPSIPTPMLLLAGLVLLTTATVLSLAMRIGKHGMFAWFHRHFFFLGAAFLLVEVHNVSRLARVFGTTWSVNAWVITGTLAMILVANFLAEKLPNIVGGTATYALLWASLLLGAVLPIEQIMGVPGGAVWLTVAYTLPFLFAGTIFARSFRETEHPSAALGANILGSLLGGLLELLSYGLGLNWLLFVAAGLYALSFRRPGS